MTTTPAPSGEDRRILVPPVPVLVAGLRHAVILTPDGELARLAPRDAARRARDERPMVVHMPATTSRLGNAVFAGHDILELYAFIRP
ncbi:MAG: hypothetical protein VR70_16560, partial [Rhodospirillaceae bacterium BRH_c57]